MNIISPLLMRRFPLLPAAVCFFLSVSVCLAAETSIPVRLTDRMDGMELAPDMAYHEDADHRLSIRDVSAPGFEWHPLKTHFINFGFSSSTHWFRLPVVNPYGRDLQWFLEINYPLLDQIDLFYPNTAGGFECIQMGDHFPFHQREVIDRNFVFKLREPPGRRTYYLRIKTTSSVNFTPRAWSPEAFIDHLNREIPVAWIYNGLLMVMAVYNLLLFISIRELSYLYYFLFISFFVLFSLTLNGFAFQFLWPDAVWWSNNCLPFFICGTLVWICLFGRAYLRSPELFPRHDKIVLYAGFWPNLVCGAVSLVLPYAVSIKLATLMAISTGILLYFNNLIVYLKGSKQAAVTLLSFTLVFVGVLLYAVKTFGFLPSHPITNWSIQIGACCMVILLSLGLADKINTMKNELSILNKELEGRVKERTSQLEDTNIALQKSLNTLKVAQKHLVQSEKMAALGGLVAGVAHEINTPLSVGITAASLLEEKTTMLSRIYAGGKMKRSALESYVRVATETSGMILKNLERAAGLVRSFKQVAVDQSTEELRKFNVKSLIEDLLMSLKLHLKKGGHTVKFKCPETLQMISYPGALTQVVTNLVMNSVIHGFENITAGKIQIEIRQEPGQMALIYSDNGKGMDEATLEKIFDPFFTTKRTHGGTGLGMHILYNLITQNLHGQIECMSSLGQGVFFLIHLPLTHAVDSFPHRFAMV